MSEPRPEFLGRRGFLRWSTLTLGLAAAAPVLQACGAAATPTPAPKAPEKPAASQPTTAPAAAPKPGPEGTPPARPTEAPKPGAAPKPAEAPKPTPTPSQNVKQAVAAMQLPKSSARINGTFTYLQFQDFHPDHNDFIRESLNEYTKQNGWKSDISYVAGFQRGSDLNQKLVASVQAGTPPDVLFHDVGVRQMQFLGILETVDDLVKEMEGQLGKTHAGFISGSNFENKWWAVPFYTRAGGYYVREDWFEDAGLDPLKDTETYDKLRETALKISDPDKKRWGWGMTVNRSGDGESMVQNLVHANGGRVQDKTGQIVTFNTPETVAGFEWLRETYMDPKWQKALPPGVNAWNDISNNEAFLAGTIGITQNAGTMLAKAYFDKVPHAETILALGTPKSKNGQGPRLHSAGGAKFHVIKGTKNKDAAYDVARFQLGTAYQQFMWRTSTAYALPAYEKGWSDPIVTGNKNSMAFKNVVFSQSEEWYGGATPGPIQAAIDAIFASNVFTDTMGEIIKGKPTKQAVEEAHKRMVRIFKEFGNKGE